MKTTKQAWNHYILHGHWDKTAGKEYENILGTEHAEELADIEPAYNWVASGSQSHAILEAMIQALDIDRDY